LTSTLCHLGERRREREGGRARIKNTEEWRRKGGSADSTKGLRNCEREGEKERWIWRGGETEAETDTLQAQGGRKVPCCQLFKRERERERERERVSEGGREGVREREKERDSEREREREREREGGREGEGYIESESENENERARERESKREGAREREGEREREAWNHYKTRGFSRGFSPVLVDLTAYTVPGQGRSESVQSD
jgi:hypothetical protein